MKKIISTLLLVSILLSLLAMSVSAIDVIDEVYLGFSGNFAVGEQIKDFIVNSANESVCTVTGCNVQYYKDGKWEYVPTSGDPCFEYDITYRFELCIDPADSHQIFDGSHLPTVHNPLSTTVSGLCVKSGSLCFYLEYGKPIVAPPSMFFNDVHTTDWFYNDVEYVYYNMMMNGVGNGNFDPNGTCTRAMVVTVLYRLEGEPGMGGTCPFTDVKEDAWYYSAVKWAQNCGVVNGMSATTFEPDTPVAREQLAAILYRYTKEVLKSDDLDGIMLMGFTDNGDISDYAGTPLSWAFGHGIIQGTDTETGKYLYPQANATRCQIAAILHRFCDAYSLMAP